MEKVGRLHQHYRKSVGRYSGHKITAVAGVAGDESILSDDATACAKPFKTFSHRRLSGERELNGAARGSAGEQIARERIGGSKRNRELKHALCSVGHAHRGRKRPGSARLFRTVGPENIERSRIQTRNGSDVGRGGFHEPFN